MLRPQLYGAALIAIMAAGGFGYWKGAQSVQQQWDIAREVAAAELELKQAQVDAIQEDFKAKSLELRQLEKALSDLDQREINAFIVRSQEESVAAIPVSQLHLPCFVLQFIWADASDCAGPPAPGRPDSGLP